MFNKILSVSAFSNLAPFFGNFGSLVPLPLVVFIFSAASLLLFIALCLSIATLWENKGHSFAGGFCFSFFLTPLLGLIVGLLMQNGKEKEEEKEKDDN
jgi:predicted tellurium resistance membrane protein TerC